MPSGSGLPELQQGVRERVARAVVDVAVHGDGVGVAAGGDVAAAGEGQRVAVEGADGVGGGGRELGHQRPSSIQVARRAVEHDVPAVAERPLRHGQAVVVGGDEPLPGRVVGHGLEDRVVGEERVAGEVHLGDEPLGERRAEEREVDVRRAARR